MKDLHCLNPVLKILFRKNYYYDIFNVDFKKTTYFSKPVYALYDQKFFNVNNIINKIGNDNYLDTIDWLRSQGNDIVELPCRKCVNCQLRSSREWCIRNSFELKKYENNAVFLTLTYNNEKLRYGKDNVATLHYEDIQYFFKRLRKCFPDKELRFFMCQEYGSHTLRPHYHIILYGLSIADLNCEFYKFNGEFNLYTSKIINAIWYEHNDPDRVSLGFNVVGEVTERSISYVSRYATKIIDFRNFENMGIEKIKNSMSRKRGIGVDYFNDNYKKIFSDDKMFYHYKDKVIPIKPIKYFDRQYEKIDNDNFVLIKEKRVNNYDFLDWYRDLDTDLKYSDYCKNLDKFLRRTFVRKEVV